MNSRMRPHFLDADELARVLAVEFGKVEDHHFHAGPETDACALENLLIFLIDPKRRHAEESF